MNTTATSPAFEPPAGVAEDASTVQSEHFTLSSMILPAGGQGPLHLHAAAEEVFFILRGRVKLTAERNGDTWGTEASDRDLISWPFGANRGMVAIGDEEALMRVIGGTAKPTNPTFPPGHTLSNVER